MTLTYTNIMSDGYIAGSDEFEEYGEDFEYEIDYGEECEALAEIGYNNYFSKVGKTLTDTQKKEIKKALRSMIGDFSDKEIESWEIAFEQELKDYFRRQAFESRED